MNIEMETNNVINMLQNAAKEANPSTELQRATNNVPHEIKRIITERKKSGLRGKEPTPLTAREITTK